MHLMFKKSSEFSRSPFQYGTMSMLESRVLNYLTMMEEATRQPYHMNGNRNILVRLLQSVTEEFTGDLVEFMGRSHRAGMGVSRTIGMTSNINTGRLHDGVLYSGCDEIFIAGRNEQWMWKDLWYDWRSVPSVVVLDHPVTDFTFFLPGIASQAKFSKPGLAIFMVDIGLLVTQWNLYRGSTKDASHTHFITSVVMPNMMRSHMDIVMLNRRMLHMGLVEECKVRTNLPFNQIPIDQEADRILEIVDRNLSGRRLDPEVHLSAIPCVFDQNVLQSIVDPGLMPTVQCMWTILASKMKRVGYILESGYRQDWAGMTDEIARIRRTIIRNQSEHRWSRGLSRQTGSKIEHLFDYYVTSRLP